MGEAAQILSLTPKFSPQAFPVGTTNQQCSPVADGTLDVTRTLWHSECVIVSFGDARTRDFALGKRVKAFSGFERSARLKLDRLEAATSLRDLAALPGNRLEALLGDRKGQYSIRINDQWRICFEWPGGSPGPTDVEIVDYH
jgi:proteic killer suppression protein